jgi:hypothetical protein
MGFIVLITVGGVGEDDGDGWGDDDESPKNEDPKEDRSKSEKVVAALNMISLGAGENGCILGV